MGIRYNKIQKFVAKLYGDRAGFFVANLLADIYENVIIFIIMCKRKSVFHLESTILLRVSIYFRWLFLPFIYFFYINNFKFLANVTSGNHVVIELDLFFRQLRNNKLLQKYKFIWITKSSEEINKVMIEEFKHNFFFATANNWLYWVTLPIILASIDPRRSPIRANKLRTDEYKDIRIETGWGRLKPQTHTNKDNSIFVDNEGGNFLTLSMSEEFRELKYAYSLFEKKNDYFPLYENFSSKDCFPTFINKNNKIALIHSRDSLRNASAILTDPLEYLETLSYLKNQNYDLIFGGREKMPSVFYDYIDFNYSESSYACFRNDILLFRLGDLAITQATGNAVYALFSNITLLYLESWQNITPSTKYCITVPTLIKNDNNKYIKYSEQLDLFRSIKTASISFQQFSNYTFRSVKSDEILEATKELISLKNNFIKPSVLQSRYQSIDKYLDEDMRMFSQMPSRISQYFINKHNNLL